LAYVDHEDRPAAERLPDASRTLPDTSGTLPGASRTHWSLLWRSRCGPRDQPAACSMVPVGTAVPVRAVVRKQIVGPFGSPIVPSGRAVGLCHLQAPTAPSAGSGVLRPGVRRVLG